MMKLTCIGVSLVFAGCAGSASGGANSADGVATQRPTEIVHEECDIEASGAERLDANGDGVADVTTVRSGSRPECQAFDLNFDGKIDSWVYFDANGKVRRRESDYDRDGRVDEVAVFNSGVVAEKYRATTLSNRLDTWDFYRAGVLARSERDSDGDSVVDQWWEYPQPECPMIHSDVDGDGRPDPGATIDFCKETGYVPPERNQPQRSGAPDFAKPDALPTEVDSKPMGSEDKAAPSDSEAPEGDAAETGGDAR